MDAGNLEPSAAPARSTANLMAMDDPRKGVGEYGTQSEVPEHALCQLGGDNEQTDGQKRLQTWRLSSNPDAAIKFE